MIVVSDASAILSLSAIGRLRLLHDLYGTVIIPKLVGAEILAGETGGRILDGAAWIETREVGDRALVDELLVELDGGESEAIALAVELNAELLLIDERRGREVAARHGLRLVGLLGSLVLAKRRGLLPLVRPVMDELVRVAGFRVSRSLYEELLEVSSEQAEP